jgi:hypothetical protein
MTRRTKRADPRFHRARHERETFEWTRPFPEAMLREKGWVVIMAVTVVAAFVIIHYL